MSRIERLLPGALALGSIAGSLLVMGPALCPMALAMLAGLGLNHHSFHRRMPQPVGFVAVYLGALAWQLLHFFEEFATGFQERLPALFGMEAWTDTRFVAFNMVFYAFFLVSGIAVLLGIRSLTYFASFFIVAMCLNGVGHVALALWVGGYFPGLGTAPVSLVWAVLLMRRLSLPVASGGTRS